MKRMHEALLFVSISLIWYFEFANNKYSSCALNRVVTEDDLDRVWDSVENAIRVMAEDDEDEYEE